MQISDKGILEIVEHEGIVLGPYLDSRSIWTFGVGHTAAAGGIIPEALPRKDTRHLPMSALMGTLHAALIQFKLDLKSYAARVDDAVKVPLKQHQFDALCSFDFNTGGIYKAKLTQAINRGDFSGDGFMGWLKPREIIGRRTAEQALFRTGDYSANGDLIPVYDVLPNGKTKFRERMDGKRLLDLMAKMAA